MADNTTPDEAFLDTCILLDFVQQDAGQIHSTELIETEAVEIVVSDAVMEELENVTGRRKDIYADLINFLLEDGDSLTDYDRNERHVYVGDNDYDHILNLQMDLRDIEENREVLRRLRMFSRAVKRRTEYLEEKLADQVIMSQAPLPLEWAIKEIIDNAADARVVTDAAGWTANGGSGVLVTRDSGDIIGFETELAELLTEEQGPEWVLRIYTPKTFLSTLALEID